MIKIYLQYSYGGFKTFFIEGKDNESVNMEVTNDEVHGFPDEAYCYFQYGGAKMVYRYLTNNTLDLVIREIPSIHKDGDGRSIPCAVQFIGDDEDRKTLDYMAIEIANNIEEFHLFFSNLFRVRGGLRIDGGILRSWINKHNVPFICESPYPQILNIPKIKSDVIFFIPMSQKYGLDEIVTHNVSAELKLPFHQMKNNNTILEYNKLSIIKNKTTIIECKTTTDTTDNDTGEDIKTIEQLKEEIKTKNTEIQKLNKNNEDLFNRLTERNELYNTLKKENASLVATNEKYKKYVGVSIVAISVLFIYNILNLIFD